MIFTLCINLFSGTVYGQTVLSDGLESNSITIEELENIEELSSNADIEGLTIEFGMLTPAFNSDITDYFVEVNHEISSVKLTVILADEQATMKINDTAQASGAVWHTNLNVGFNYVTIDIVAEDGITDKTYRLTIERMEPSAHEMQFMNLNQTFSSTLLNGEVLQVAAGNNHSLGLKADGTVWAWGSNENGRLGNGTTTNSNTSIQVSGLNSIIAVAAGNGHSLALKADGTVWAWGKNDKGQLGDGSTTHRTTPVQVSGLSDIKSITTGHTHSMALKEDGTVWAWGENGSGRLGDNTTNQRNTPVQVRKGITTSTDDFLQGVIAISAGKEHSVVLRADEKVYAWGSGSNGMLGNGSGTASSIPVEVSNLSDIVQVSTQGDHTMALRGDGTVWAWGNNGNGRLGDGTTSHQNVPVQVSDLTDVKTVNAGNNFSVVLKNDGTVWTWGQGDKGQLGDGSSAAKSNPVQVLKGASESQDAYLQNIQALSAGNNYVLAVKLDDTVWAWGDNGNGRLGDGTTANKMTPVMNQLIVRGTNADLANLTIGTAELTPAFDSDTLDYLAIVDYDTTSIDLTAVLADPKASMTINNTAQTSGTTRTITLNVGYNSIIIEVLSEDNNIEKTYTLTINRATSDMTAPPAPTDVAAIAASGQAIINFNPPASNGGSTITEYTVLSNPGNIRVTGTESPIIVTGLTNGVTYTFTVTATNIAGEGAASEASNSVTPLAKHNADLGSLKINRGILEPAFQRDITAYEVIVSQRISSLSLTAEAVDTQAVLQLNDEPLISQKANMLELETGENSFIIRVMAEDGITYKNYTLTIIRSEEDLESPADILQVAGGNKHSLILKGDGTVWAWGNNENGQLGDGTTANSSTPIQVSGLINIVAIEAGNDHSVALADDGAVWAWGKNEKGQLGDGTTSNKTTPVQVSNLSDVQMITAGHNHSLAIKKDGTLWSWGSNEKGQLGIGSASQSTVPAQVLKGVTTSTNAFLQDIAAIAGGKEHTVALKADGTVYAWGNGSNGRLGNGGTASYNTPVQVSGLTEVTMISIQGEHTMALRSNGTVWSWGKNDKGQLGDGTTTNRTSPVQAAGLTDVAIIAAGNNFSAVLKNNGTVWTWGNNEKGQLGNGTNTQSNIPVQVLKGMSESIDTYLQGVEAIAAANNHVLAVKSDQTLWAWGDNGDGRLGDGTTTNQTSPIQILLTDKDTLPELPEEPIEDDYEIASDYWLTDSLLAFQIHLGFNLLADITGLLDPNYTPQPQEPEEPEEPSEEPLEPGEEPEQPSQGGDSSSRNNSETTEKAPQPSQLITSLDGKTYMESRINHSVLKQVLQQAANQSAIQLEIPIAYGKAVLTLDHESLKILKENKTSAVITAEKISYIIPYHFAALEQLSLEKGSPKMLKIMIEKAPLTAAYLNGYKMLLEPVQFRIEAVFVDETVEIKHFGNQYIERRIVLNHKIDPKKAVGAVWENNSWHAVPTTFIEERGVMTAIIKRNGNSIYTVIENEKTFEDISSHWAKANIEILASKNIVSGMDHQRFGPNSQITRAQFVAMLIRSIGYKGDETASKQLKDVSEETWYGKYVDTAMKLGIITGYEDGTFRPNKEITREEMAAMIMKTVQLIKKVDENAGALGLADKNQISPWAEASAKSVVSAGIMGGYEDQTFRPKNKATRAEAVTVFKNMMTYLDFITY